MAVNDHPARFSIHSAVSRRYPSPLRMRGILPAIKTLGAIVRSKTASVVHTLQVARMMSVLSEMSDTQLAQIGITRSDIPRYAASLFPEYGRGSCDRK